MAAPYALVASCSEVDPKSLVQQILEVDTLPECVNVLEDIQAYPWDVETKYYTANVNVCLTYSRTIGNEEFANGVCAFILHFDSENIESFDKVKMWIPFLKEIQPEVQILVCNRCSEKGINKQVAWAWCLDNQFELVELNPVIEEQDEEDDFQETVGIQRIIQALHAHTWPNLVMKSESTFRSPYMNKMMQEQALENKEVQQTDELPTGVSFEENEVSNLSEANSNQSNNPEDTTLEVGVLNGLPGLSTDNIDMLSAMPSEETDEEEFEELFSKLRLMKERADELPLEQRKAYAEQVALQFWKAIGGDEEEIAGLDDKIE